MCGIAGFLGGPDHSEVVMRGMSATLRHRGPDDSGTWCDAERGVALVHRRLSIVDLSCAGHQPMVSATDRFVMTFNGEIYNHLELRTQLEREGPTKWRGHSDTETLLAGFDAWGISSTIQRAVGMFAFVVWDKLSQTLTLVRDRVGEKPLYYGWQGDVFLFGSELKALKAHPSFLGKVDRDSVALFMRHNYIPAPYSIYQGISKQTPGTLVTVSRKKRSVDIEPYWDARRVVREGITHPFTGSPDEAVSSLRDKLRTAVRGQMMADVPLGAFLSGGVDSSLIVALMQEQSNRPAKTFTIGFGEAGYNEAPYAKSVALHLGTDHTELYVSPQDALGVIPQLPTLFCEPFADSSQIPTFLVSRLARTQVTVSLSGDAGDELFGGYNRYTIAQKLWERIARVPRPARVRFADWLESISPSQWKRLLGPVQSLLPYGLAQSNIGDKMAKGARVLGATTPRELYHLLVSHWPNPEQIVINAHEPPTPITDRYSASVSSGFIHEFMELDLLTYLPDDILVKVDRAAMGVSLETRVPLLDHRVVEFAWTLPLSYKLRNGVTKWALRQLLYEYVPKGLIERPKMGFGVPIDSWLRGPLRDWAEDLLCESRIKTDGFLEPAPIRQKWAEHLSGTRNWQYPLWNVLMFQAWLHQPNS